MVERMSADTDGGIEASEHILTREEVIAAIERHVVGYTIARELSDEHGPTLLEVTIPGENPGQVTEYRYQRKGSFGKNQTATTHLAIAYYEDEMPVGGKTLENYDEATGVWK